MIEVYVAIKPDYASNKFGEVLNTDIAADADIHMCVTGIGLHEKQACIGEVVDMQKFA